MLVLLLVLRRGPQVRAIWRDRRVRVLLTVAAAVISVNWATYIWGVNNGRVDETSLGYFINPLVTVLIGIVAFRERLRVPQWVAVGLGASAVLVLTFGYHQVPWVGLVLALSFGTYGVVKKIVGMPAVESLSVEATILLLPSLVYLGWLEGQGRAAFPHEGVGHVLLMVGVGVITAVPLLLFSAAAPRVPLTTLGLLQYITPSMQFALGVLVFGEELSPLRLAGFGIVWTALVVFSVDGLRHARRESLAASVASIT
jgi:chloramphenicol-sensitive protein RarD